MSQRTNTVPYTNARRAGRTDPDLVEFIEGDDPRRRGPRYVPNRADLRAQGIRGPQRRRYAARCRRTYREAVQA